MRISGSAEFDQGYGYDGASRLDTAVLDGNGVSYSYLTNADLIGTMTFERDETTRMTTTRSYESLNRLTEISSESLWLSISNAGYVVGGGGDLVTNVVGNALVAATPDGPSNPVFGKNGPLETVTLTYDWDEKLTLGD